jgi:hypothetical protein
MSCSRAEMKRGDGCPTLKLVCHGIFRVKRRPGHYSTSHSEMMRASDGGSRGVQAVVVRDPKPHTGRETRFLKQSPIVRIARH